MLSQLSNDLALLVASAGRAVAAVTLPGHRPLSAILWRPGVAVTSEQSLAEADAYKLVLPGGKVVDAKPSGRDSGTNVTLLTYDGPAEPLAVAAPVTAGALTVTLGTDGEGGAVAHLAMLRQVGPAWHSAEDGKIDRLLVLDGELARFREGGPVVDAEGRLIGMSTTGPRYRALVIPHETIERVIDPLLKEGKLARGWLGVGLHPVRLPEALEAKAGHEAGLMVASLAAGGPADTAGVLPGDIILALDGEAAARYRGVTRKLAGTKIGEAVALKLLRAGEVQELSVTVGPRP